MAKKIQCEQCDAFINERGLCRKEWKLVEFDDKDCELYGKDKPQNAGVQDSVNMSELLIEPTPNPESLSELSADLRQRHGCATAWLAFMFIACSLIILRFLTLLLFTNLNEEQLTDYISYIISAGIMLTAVILLYKWNVWGLYIIMCIVILNILGSILIDGKFSSGIGSFGAMIGAFSLQAKDGYTFFDHLGVTNRRKRAQRAQMSYYIKQMMRKSDRM